MVKEGINEVVKLLKKGGGYCHGFGTNPSALLALPVSTLLGLALPVSTLGYCLRVSFPRPLGLLL